MATYFGNLPLVIYPSLEDSNNTTNVVLTNILTRSAFIREVANNSALFYDYRVKENETPEIIADKLYGDVNRFWIILLFNNIMDPYYGFPLNQEQLNDMFQSKYGYSAETAQSTIHHYEKRVVTEIYLNNILQSTHTDTYVISEQEQNDTGIAQDVPTLPATPDTYNEYESSSGSFTNGVSVIKKYQSWAISTYSYESDLNEKRRNIKLLDVSYVGPVENEFKRLMTNG